MAIVNAIRRLKREIGIKRCVIIEGNVSDVFLNEKGQIVSPKTYIEQIMSDMGFDTITQWDQVDGSGNDNSISIKNDSTNTAFETEQYFSDSEFSELTGDVPKQEPLSYNPNITTGPLSHPNITTALETVMNAMRNKNKKVGYIIDWADYLFSGTSQLRPEEREQLVLLGKAVRENIPDVYSLDVNQSTVVMIVGKISMFPLSFYQGNPEVSSITIPKPDREEREKMMAKIATAFNVVTERGNGLMNCDKTNEYIDMLSEFTNREIIQMAKLSQKEDRMTFDKLYLLFKYGEKDNPWEKLSYEELKRIKERLGERVIGQDSAIERIEKVVIKAYMGVTGLHKTSSRSMPKGVLFFVGPTGVGKTELSKALAKFLFGDEDACIRFDMSEYAQENSDQKLIGAPPGYVGYEEGGQLTNAIKEKPFSVILFDEIEKAAKPNPRILDIFLQILEDGRLTDSKGETVYFSESIIIFTSNLGTSEIQPDDDNIPQKFIECVKRYFDNEIKRPELLGRIGYNNIVPFNFIQDIGFRQKIAQSKLAPIKRGIKEKYHLDLRFDDELAFIDFVLGDSDAKKGGRDILNAINDTLLDELAMFLFSKKSDLNDMRGSTICVSVKNKSLSFRFE